MYFSERLSSQIYWANFLRLLISCLSYELFVVLKQAIRLTSEKAVQAWQVSIIRTRLLKIGATIRKSKRRITYCLSKAFVHQRLLRELIAQ